MNSQCNYPMPFLLGYCACPTDEDLICHLALKTFNMTLPYDPYFRFRDSGLLVYELSPQELFGTYLIILEYQYSFIFFFILYAYIYIYVCIYHTLILVGSRLFFAKIILNSYFLVVMVLSVKIH